MIERLLDLDELLYLFKKKFWIIIVITAITTSLAIYKVSKLQPSYSANAKVFMGNSADMLDIYSQEELSSYSQFINIFSEISRIDGFLDKTLKKNHIDKTSLEVASALSFSSSVNTPIVNITYSNWTDDQMAETLDAVCDELIDKVEEIMPGTKPTILSEATVSTIYPDKKKLPIVAFVAGIFLSIGLILGLDFIDSKINSKRQLEKALPIPVLGSIPKAEKEFRKEIKDVCNEKNAEVAVSRSL